MAKDTPKKVYKLMINNRPFEWAESVISGAQLRSLGSIVDDEDLYLKVNESAEDQLIIDEVTIDLEQPGIEQFYSKASVHSFKIIVNGRPKNWDKQRIAFEDVILLAFGQYFEVATMVYTVAYEDGPRQNPEGSMVRGMSVFVKDQMIFHATATDKS
jgi:hypothetical protein